jgi:ATP-dependent DNA ligase
MNTVYTVSPYHRFRLDLKNGVKPMSLTAGKLLEYLDTSKTNASIPFVQLANALESISEDKTRTHHISIVQSLLSSCFDVASTVDKHSDTNISLETYLLLCMLLPNEDSETVYGLKCTRLVRLFSRVLKALGRSDASAQLEQWINDPIPEFIDINNVKHVICAPEVVIAKLMSVNSNNSKAIPLTLQDVGSACQQLTEAYLFQSDDITGIENTQIQIMKRLSQHFQFKEWYVFVKIVLKKMSMGIGPITILKSIPHIDAPSIYKKQHDLAKLAELSVQHKQDPKLMWKSQSVQIVCGIPFTPMTCENLKSPYLFKWIFSSEELLEKLISPKDGRLIISSVNGNWYIPLSHNAKQKTFVSIYEDHILKNKSRKQHVLLLRELRRQKMLNVESCYGFVIHYTFSRDNDKTIIMLIRLVSDPIAQGIKLYDDTVLDILDEEISPAEKSLSKQENIERLVNNIAKHSGSEDGGNSKEATTVSFKIKSAFELVMKRKSNKNMKASINTVKRALSLNTRVPLLRRSQQKTVKSKNDSENKTDEISNANKVIVQLKYDGDRIQAHIDNGFPQKITLFTKNGKNVSELYSDIVEDLKKCTSLSVYTPCILDGELIVVGENDEPLPWTSEKWRYNTNSEKTCTIDKLNEVGMKPDAILTIVQDTFMGMKADDENYTVSTINNEDSNTLDLTFASVANISKWHGIGPSFKKHVRCRPIENKSAKLRYVVFDILMHQGKEVCEQGYFRRLNILRSYYAPILLHTSKHSEIISRTEFIDDTRQLISLLSEVITKKEEGLILKDPNSEYCFGKTKRIQKLKVSGPDVNSMIIGAGFSLSSNPHRWGLLTCIQVNPTGQTYVNYCRTEVLEGMEVWKTLEHVLSLKSKFKVSDIKRLVYTNTNSFVENKYYKLEINVAGNTTKNKHDELSIKFVGKDTHTSIYNCVIYIQRHVLSDIQWLCNPLECMLGLSIRGDLRPLHNRFYMLQKDILYPRHPVGRIELSDFQKSNCDDIASVQEKMNTMIDAHDTIEEHFINTVKRLRPMYPSTDRQLQLLRRILIGYKNSYKDDQKDNNWPQMMPSTSFSLGEFSSLIEEFHNKVLFQERVDSFQKDRLKFQKHAFRPLTSEERNVLVKLGNKSIWDMLSRDKSLRTNIETHENSIENSKTMTDIHRLMKRMDQLKDIKSPVIQTSSNTNYPLNTHEDEHLIYPDVITSSDSDDDDPVKYQFH